MKIEKFDLDLIVERLQLLNSNNCGLMSASEVKQALTKWLNTIVESINDEPEWWVQNHNISDFYTHLPEPVFECEEDDSDFVQVEVISQQKEPATISLIASSEKRAQ
ncbi:hypothetical protein M595_5762 [Lyngbya aestuarii BL J]|uniref:Uncharacterized protein n=1 Tax=Lyngbya aestuarii BL J TaxID=1348334 RepID=U7QB85_9CYAN|nr:hypothetical protein [Lyngbya aestuarii]ERT04305.1 hypothetical protein M595_5762 [Lyngbya aestuarii BL J]